MFPVVWRRGAGEGGFTLIEALVVLAIFGFMLALGVPRMSLWSLGNKAAAATEFYAEGFRLARAQAMAHNAAGRILLTENAGNGQLDWQVDICFPTVVLPCNSQNGAWSTPSSVAAGDPEGGAGFKSVLRSASVLPGAQVLQQTLTPSGATDIYFTSLGWVDTNFSPRLARIQMAPTPAYAGSIPTSAIVVTLAGIATKCDPGVAVTDSRACPP